MVHDGQGQTRTRRIEAMAVATEMTGRPTTSSQRQGSLAWTLGPAIGLAAIGAMLGTGAGFSVTDDLPVATMIEKLDAASSGLLLGGALQAVVAMALVVFGAWIARRLREVEPPGSTLSMVAFGGFGLAAAMAAVAGAHTQLVSGDASLYVDPAVPLALHAMEESLFAAAFCVLAVAAGAVAVAGLRHRVVPTWLGGVSAFITALLLVLQVVVPWAGWFPGAVWLVVVGVGMRGVGHDVVA
jgi:hypothetical protein